MIDLKARSIASSLLEKIILEKLTNWQLEDSWPNSPDDPALNCILRWIWTYYDDDKEVILSTKMTDKDLVVLERCRQFLKTDIEFPLRQLSEEQKLKIRNEWGIEWRADCTGPEDDKWPFPSDEEKH